MKLNVKISIANKKDESFMGMGLVLLLQGIKKHKSIYNAAKSMEMSYSKAIKILNRLEKNLGEKVITRRHGGNDRCGAEITSFGEKYVKKFDDFQKKIKKYAENEFKKVY